MIVPIIADGDFNVEVVDKITNYYIIGMKLNMNDSIKEFKFIHDLYTLSKEYDLEQVIMYGEVSTELVEISTNLIEMVSCLLDYDFYNAEYKLIEAEGSIDNIKTNYSFFNKYGSIDSLSSKLDTLFDDAQSLYDAVLDERYEDAEIFKTNLMTNATVLNSKLGEHIACMKKFLYILEQYS